MPDLTEDRLKEIKAKVDRVLREEGVRIKPGIVVLEDRIQAIVTVVPTEEKVIEEVKSSIIVPK